MEPGGDPARDALEEIARLLARTAGKRRVASTVALVTALAGAILALPPTRGEPKLVTVERRLLARALNDSGGNVSAAARLLGMERKAFERRCARLRIGRVASRVRSR